MAMDNSGGRDLVLAPGEYAYVQDTTKGLINMMVGPTKVSMSNTDQPVVFEKRFKRVDRIDQAIRVNTIAPEGYYIALFNPCDKMPTPGTMSTAPELTVGHRVNTPGPANFPLWPGQFAQVIQGHHLRSNQYLLAQVYNDAEATKNWKAAVIKPQGVAGEAPKEMSAPKSFAPGQLLIINGTEVAFYIPPTGIKVVPDEHGSFVRDAVTLERLEYCILRDEDGNKRFERGPAVVFPAPTEEFVEKADVVTGGMARKFKAIDLNATTGIYVKVIADYEEDGRKYKAGDELFITGKEQAIYFQREEHSVIRYGDQTKHYAVAVPSGEGRYVLDRTVGKVNLVRGPSMLLPDPRTEVIIRRILAEATAALWYPGNDKVVAVNRELAQAAQMSAARPTGITGGVVQASLTTSGLDDVSSMNYLSAASAQTPTSRQIAGDVFARGTTFTPPRTVVLDTKYDGAVSINIWTGYAVQVINKTGGRRVVVGPENVLLEYDETLAPLELSTGKPKSTLKTFKTVYLKVGNNVVSDVITVETKDLVQASVSVSYRVNFEGTTPEEREKWFSVENYVRLLTDHCRSLIRNTVKRKGIEEFYGNAIDILRDATLGTAGSDGKRTGRAFSENGMRVYDVEVLDVKIDNPSVASLLGTAQLNSLKQAIQISEAERTLATTKRSEDIARETATVKAETSKLVAEQQKIELTAKLAVNTATIAAEADEAAQRLAARVASQETLNKLTDAEIARRERDDASKLTAKTAEIDLELKKLLADTEQIVKRAGAISPTLAAALTTFSDNALVEKISTSLAPMAAMSGISAADVLSQLFKGTPFESVMKTLGTRSRMPATVETMK